MPDEPSDDTLERAGVDDMFVHAPCAVCGHRSTAHIAWDGCHEVVWGTVGCRCPRYVQPGLVA